MEKRNVEALAEGNMLFAASDCLPQIQIGSLIQVNMGYLKPLLRAPSILGRIPATCDSYNPRAMDDTFLLISVTQTLKYELKIEADETVASIAPSNKL